MESQPSAPVVIALLGATGATGHDVAERARDRGWGVRAFVRSPATADNGFPHGTEIVVGDVLDPVNLQSNLIDVTAVISVLGFRRTLHGPAGTTLYSRAASSLVEAMTAAKVRRLIFCTSAGVEPHDPATLWPYEHIVKPLWLQPTYDDMITAETTIRQSDLDWVLVRPGRLTDGPAAGELQVSGHFRPEHANSLTRGQLADFMLDQVTDDTWVHGTPTLGSRKAT